MGWIPPGIINTVQDGLSDLNKDEFHPKFSTWRKTASRASERPFGEILMKSKNVGR